MNDAMQGWLGDFKYASETSMGYFVSLALDFMVRSMGIIEIMI